MPGGSSPAKPKPRPALRRPRRVSRVPSKRPARPRRT
jgi:hypothetical protein